MAHINFLEPPRFSLRQFNLKNFELNYFFMMVIAGALLMFMITYGMVQRHRVSSLDEALTEAAAETKKASGAKPATADTSQKTSLMDTLQQRVVWSPILNAIALRTPDTVSLNYIKGNSGGARTMKLEGVGADVLSAARYEEDLSTVPFFSKVTLQSSATSGAATAGKTGAKSDAKPVSGSGGEPRLTFEIQGWLK